MDTPFFTLSFVPAGTGTEVEAAEGIFGYGLTFKPTKIGMTADVERWISGDRSCRNMKSVLNGFRPGAASGE
jgi:hypothetical protein